jgi:hypothetical protein
VQNFTQQQRSEQDPAAAAMEARRTGRSLLASFVLAALAAQALVAVVESRTGPVEKLSQGTSLLLS